MRCLNQAPLLIAFALSSFLLEDAKAADGNQAQETIRSLEMKSRTDSFLQHLGQGRTWIVQVVSYKFTPQIRIYEMGAANPSVRGVVRGHLMASSLESETGRRETSDCQAFQYGDERGNTVHGAEVHMTPLHNGPYLIMVTGSPTLASASTKTFDYRIVIEADSATIEDMSIPPLDVRSPQPTNWRPTPNMTVQPQPSTQVPQSGSRFPSTPLGSDHAQFPPGPDTADGPTAADMLSEGESLLRALGLIP